MFDLNAELAAGPWCITKTAYKALTDAAQSLKAIITKPGEYARHSWNTEVRDNVAIIPVKGPLFRNSNYFTWYGGGTSVQSIAEDLASSLENHQINSIVLYIDSPGGQVSGISELSDYIFESRNKKPIVAYVDNMAASGGYWLASSCSKIVVNQTSMVGSIGVIQTIPKQNKDNVVETISDQSPLKCADPESPEGKEQSQLSTNALADIFISSIAKFKNIPKSKVENDFGKGGLLIGQQAVQAGMADYVNNFENTLKAIKNLKNTNGGKMLFGANQTLEQQVQDLARQNPQAVLNALNQMELKYNTNQNPVPSQPQAPAATYVDAASLQRESYEQGKRETIARTKEIMQYCALSGLKDTNMVASLVETQNLQLVQSYLTAARQKVSDRNAISSGFASDQAPKNELMDEAQKMVAAMESKDGGFSQCQ